MMHATQIKHKELVEVLVVVLRGFAPWIIWKVGRGVWPPVDSGFHTTETT